MLLQLPLQLSLFIVVFGASRFVAAMDWALLSSVEKCIGRPAQTTATYVTDDVIPVTLPAEPIRCISYAPTAPFRYAVYADATKRSLSMYECRTSNCTGVCNSYRADMWANSPTQDCGDVFVPVSSNPVLAIGDMDTSLPASTVAKLNNGYAASAYFMQLVYPPEANCSGDPIYGTLTRLFETCTRVNTTHYAMNIFSPDGQTDAVTQTCTDAQCTVGCARFFATIKPAPKGSASRSQCLTDALFSKRPFEGKGLVASSMFPLAIPQAAPVAAPGNSTNTGSSEPSTLSPAIIAALAAAGVVVAALVAALVVWSRRTASRPTNPRDATAEEPGTQATVAILPPKTRPTEALQDLQVDSRKTLQAKDIVPAEPPARGSRLADPRMSSVPPSYQDAEMAHRQIATDVDNQLYGVIEASTSDAARRDSSSGGQQAMAAMGSPAIDADMENQQYGVMEADYRLR